MSAAYKCDKCSEYIDGAPTLTVTFTLRDGKPWSDPMGICMSCGQQMVTPKEQVEERAKQARVRDEQDKQSARLREEASEKARKP